MNHKIESIKLQNGARLINISVENLPISIVSAWFRAGSRFDPIGKEGLAHLLEHLYIKRTKNHPDYFERLKKLESLGIDSNAFTTYETVHFYHTQQKEETYASLDLLLDVLNDYILIDDDIENEKKTVLNEMAENKLNPNEFIWNLSNQGLWKNSSMGRNFFGNEESINSIELGDLEKFIEKYYVHDNLVFVIVGNEKTINLQKYLNTNLTRFTKK